MKRYVEFLESTLMTVVSGFFVVLSLVLSVAEIDLIVDPAWGAVIISGIPILYSAAKKLIKNHGISKISSALLISAAMIAASVIGDIFAAGEVAFIMAIGEMLEHKTTGRARRGLKEFISIVPQRGRVILDGCERMVLAEEIQVGDIIRILPGETIPIDGEIISGETSVDQSVMTGESLPVDKTIGNNVFCGTINRFGSIDIRATKAGGDSSLSKLIAMVKAVENKKAPTQRIADRWASILVPVALIIAIFTYIITRDITRAVTVLVVFCPCALVLATPTAIMAAIGQATKHGIIIKSGEALEKMEKVNTVALDKTGTLTRGKLTVCDIISFTEMYSDREILEFGAAAELKSEHPIGCAILAYAKEQDIDILEPADFKMEAGRGVRASIANTELICGNEGLLVNSAVEITADMKSCATALRNDGKALVFVAANNVCIGIIALSDVIKEESKKIVNSLRDVGAGCVLLTGDSRAAANFFAKQVGIAEIYAELMPDQKMNKIEVMRADGKILAMVGDGVNDAPALKCADVGIAMGSMGSDIAVEAADIAIMSDDVSKISYLKRLSNATVNTVKFSISLSLIINFAAIIMSFFGILTPATGALVHNAGSIFVIMIAALLYDRKFI